MTEHLHVGTRKGLFSLSRGTTGWAIDRVDSLGIPVSINLYDPREKTLFAGLKHGHFGVKLQRSRDNGATWDECPVPVYPEGALIGGHPFSDEKDPANQPKPASLTELWALETGGSDQPGRLWAGTIPGGLFRSDDNGDSWQLVESLWNLDERLHWFGGGRDLPGIHSICVDPRDSRRVAVAISCGGVWITTDDGETWTCFADGMRAEYLPPDQAHDPNLQDVHRLVQSPTQPDVYWVQHHNGIFHTTDGAKSWTELEDVPVSSFGFATVVHPTDGNTAWFVPGVNDECRIPVDAQLAVTRTRDSGKTFDVLRNGLPQSHAYDIVFRHGMDIDETGDRLAIGSSTGGLWISENGGETWECVSTNLPQIYCVRFAK